MRLLGGSNIEILGPIFYPRGWRLARVSNQATFDYHNPTTEPTILDSLGDSKLTGSRARTNYCLLTEYQGADGREATAGGQNKGIKNEKELCPKGV